MLTWSQQADGWHSNGYIIRLVEPFRWILTVDDPAESSCVSVEIPPLATARTFTECKREAELLAAAEERSALRRRCTASALFAVCGSIFAAGLLAPWNVILVAVLGVYALRSVMLITGTIFYRHAYQYHDFFYQ